MKRVRVAVRILVLGALVNVAAAWGLAVSLDKGEASADALRVSLASPAEGGWCVLESRCPGAHWLFAIQTRDEGRQQETFQFFSANPDLAVAPFDPPHWMPLADTSDPELRDLPLFRSSQAFGWPLPALSYVGEYGWVGDYVDYDYGREYWAFDVDPGAARWNKRFVPLRPVWPGLAGNTVLYALLLWAAWFLAVTMRRAARRARGRCLRCGYDLRGSGGRPCPECGGVQPGAMAA